MTASEEKAELVKALRQIEAFARLLATSEVSLSDRSLRAGCEDVANYARTVADRSGEG